MTMADIIQLALKFQQTNHRG